LNGVYLQDNATTNHITQFTSTFFSTPSVNYINLLPVTAPAAGINGTVYNVGASTSTAGTTTIQPFSTISQYATTHNQYISAADTTPLTVTGTSTTKTAKLTNSTTGSTYTLKAEYTNTGNYDAELRLVSSNTNTNSVNLESRNNLGDYTTLNMRSNNANLYTGTPSGATMEQTGIQLTVVCDTYYASDTTLSVIASANISRIDSLGFNWGTGTPTGAYPNPTPMTLTNQFMRLDTTGLLSFFGDTYGIQNRTTTTTLTSPVMTINGQNLTFRNFQLNFFGTTNTVTTYTFSAIPINCNYTVAVYNGGSGNATFTNTATNRFNGNVNFVVPTLRYATINIKLLRVNATQIYFMDATLF
jgi:hypothetical protein